VPVNAITLATAGSFLITPTICRIESSIAGNDDSCGPCTAPASAPVSSTGKKPFGISTISTPLSAMVSSSTIRTGIGRASTQVRLPRYHDSTRSKIRSQAR
jgi:hypothetical protein